MIITYTQSIWVVENVCTELKFTEELNKAYEKFRILRLSNFCDCFMCYLDSELSLALFYFEDFDARGTEKPSKWYWFFLTSYRLKKSNLCNKTFILHTVGKMKCNVGREMLFMQTDYITVSQYTVTP